MAVTTITRNGKSFDIEHKDGVSVDTLNRYVDQVVIPQAKAEEAGPFDFFRDAETRFRSEIVKGSEAAVGGIQQFFANAVRLTANDVIQAKRNSLIRSGKTDSESFKNLEKYEENANRYIDAYLDVAYRQRKPMRELGDAIANSRFLDQDNVVAQTALDTIGVIGYMTPMIAAGVATRGGAFPTLVGSAQAVEESISDMEQSLGKDRTEFTPDERNIAANVSTIYGVGSAALIRLLSVPALGLDKANKVLMDKFLKGKVTMPAGKLKRILNTAKGGLGESVEEMSQGQFLDTLAKFNYDNERQLVGKEVLNKRMKEGLIAFFAGGTVRGGIEIIDAVGNTEIPTPTREAISEEQRAGLSKFSIKYKKIIKEKGRPDREELIDTIGYYNNLEEAKAAVTQSLETQTGIVTDSIDIQEIIETAVEDALAEDEEVDPTLTEEPPMGTETEAVTDPQQTGAEIPIGVFGAVDLDQVEGLTPQQKKKIEAIREEARQEANKLLIALADPTGTLDEQAVKEGLEALDDPTGAVDTKAVEDGLKALREISEEGTVGARKIDPKTIETFDKIREMERRQAEVFREEYVPSTNEQLLRRLESTIIDRGPRTTSGSIRLNIVGARKIPAVDTIDTVIDSPTVVPTDPSEGGRVRSIAKKYQLPENEVLDLTDDGTIDEGAKRIEAVLEKAFARFPKFEAWYSTRLKMAFDILTKLDPDLAKAEDSFVMKVLLAITSNGNEVSPQTQESYRIYQNWKNTGSIAVDSTQGTRQDALLGHLASFDELLKKHGFEKMKSFMDKSGTVKELRKDLVDNFGFTSKEAISVTAGENVDTEVPFAFILGPKLGSFYNNLNGNFDTTTMDRWFMRTFGRTMGTQLLKVSGFQQKVDRFLSSIKNLKGDPFLDRPIGKKDTRPIKDLLPKGKKVDISDLKKLSIWFGKKENRAGIIKGSAIDEFRKALNNLHKSGDGFVLLEAPKNGSHRVYIRKVMDKALTSFNSNNNVNFTPAEAQALLWYYEKLVHESNGSRQKDEAPDYATAAERVYQNETGRESGRYVLSDAIRSRGEVSRSDDVVSQEEQPGQVQTVTDTTVGAKAVDPRVGFVGASTENVSQTQTNVDGSVSSATKSAKKLGVDVVENLEIDGPARYNYSTQTIEYNPDQLALTNKEGMDAIMREEVIHAAMHKVIMKRFPKLGPKAAFEKVMSQIGKSMTPEQKIAIENAYGELKGDINFGAEYTRFLVQNMFYGNTTEGALLKGKAFEKVQALIKSVQRYLSGLLKSDISGDRFTAQMMVDTVRLLQQTNPEVKPANQAAIDEALKVLTGTEENVVADSMDPFMSQEQRDKFKKKQQRDRFFKKVLQTASLYFSDINVNVANVLREFFGRIDSRTTEATRMVFNFQKGLKGIKNKADKKRLKKLLAFNPRKIDLDKPRTKELIKERNDLLLKYNLLNDFNLQIRPLLDQLREDGIGNGLNINYLFEYFPRKVKDLAGLLNHYGKELEQDFIAYKEQLEAENGKKFEAQEVAALFEEYMRNKSFVNPSKIPSFIKQRVSDELSDAELKFYYEPEETLGMYINTLINASEMARLIGAKEAVRGDLELGIDLQNPYGELQLAIAREIQAGRLDSKGLDDINYGLTYLFGHQSKEENIFGEFGRPFAYASLLVDPTTTLSQYYDLAFMMLDNDIGRVIKQIFSEKDFTLKMAGIDPTAISAEFAPNNKGKRKVLNNAVKFGLQLSGFTRMDQLLKETNLSVNYNRYRRDARMPVNSKAHQKIRKEIEFMVGEDVDRVIADLRNDVEFSPYVREIVVRKLLETQPINRFEMPLVVSKDPNARMWYTMKSFVVKQTNLVGNRMIAKILRYARGQGSRDEALKAIAELFYLIFLFQLVGIPVDFAKDMIAGRDVYPDDYVAGGLLRIFGLSKYNLYEAQRDPGQAFLNYVIPVPFAQMTAMARSISSIVQGRDTIDEFELFKYLPLNDLWYYRFGPGQKTKAKKRYRREEKGVLPLLEL